jgi:hypothetical protein
MHKRLATIRIFSFTLALLALLVASGCETTSNWLKGRKTADAEDVTLDAPQTNQYLIELQDLASGDPATQAEIYADAEAAATLTPDPQTRLRYALVLATTGHSEWNAGEAQGILRDLLSQTEMMNSVEVALATIYLNEVEDRIVLESELGRLRSSASRATTTEDAAIARRISTIENENRQLRESLADAESKIEALSSIERSIREQNENGDSQ